MPGRPTDPENYPALQEDILRRLRELERRWIELPEGAKALQTFEDGSLLGDTQAIDFGPGVRAALIGPGYVKITAVGGNAYSWQSARALTVSTGIKFFTERDGAINFVRADRSTGDGTSTATIDVLKNGTTIYPTSPVPSVDAGDFLGPERPPDISTFVKGDYFECSITATGGGTGPLRVTFNLQD